MPCIAHKHRYTVRPGTRHIRRRRVRLYLRHTLQRNKNIRETSGMLVRARTFSRNQAAQYLPDVCTSTSCDPPRAPLKYLGWCRHPLRGTRARTQKLRSRNAHWVRTVRRRPHTSNQKARRPQANRHRPYPSTSLQQHVIRTNKHHPYHPHNCTRRRQCRRRHRRRIHHFLQCRPTRPRSLAGTRSDP